MQLQSITGNDILKAIVKKNRRGIGWCIVGIIAAAAVMAAGLLLILEDGRVFNGVLMIAVSILGAYFALYYISVLNKKRLDPEHCELFRKFGTPDSIAQTIARESGEPLHEAKGVLVCDSFIMRKNDFESYIPLSEALAVYRSEHRTNGIPDAVYLVVTDSFGKAQQYPFRFGKAGKEAMARIMEHISQKAPDCVFGYSREVLDYIARNRRTLS